ncbi:hypothetical protein LZ32DRAFT_610209, partial [Colletotrichum eremochloae]
MYPSSRPRPCLTDSAQLCARKGGFLHARHDATLLRTTTYTYMHTSIYLYALLLGFIPIQTDEASESSILPRRVQHPHPHPGIAKRNANLAHHAALCFIATRPPEPDS